MTRPLILVTNDDGVNSAGLWAIVSAVIELGEVLVVAPARQWSGGARSMVGRIAGDVIPMEREVNGARVRAYGIEASPARAVMLGVLRLSSRQPDLVISGANFGVNVGSDVTISGTVGAALEASAFGIPAIAISLEMEEAYHLTGDEKADYTATQAFARYFAECLLRETLPFDVHAININVPSDATCDTPWRLTRLSRLRYFVPRPVKGPTGEHVADYVEIPNLQAAEPDSDIWALKMDRMVTVTPISLDLTSRTDFSTLSQCFRPNGDTLPSA